MINDQIDRYLNQSGISQNLRPALRDISRRNERRVDAENSRKRSDAEYRRRLAANSKAVPGSDSPHKQARELHKAGKSLLVISGLTGLSRRVLAALLGLPAPPTEDGCTITGQDGRVGERSTTPALWGTDAVFDGPIVPRTYRVLHDADLTSDGHAMGSEWLTTHDFGEALNNCHGKNSVVVDERGLVLAKGVKHFYRKDKYDGNN